MTGPQPWSALLAAAERRLRAAAVEEADTKLRWVAAHLLGCGLADVFRHAAQIPTPEHAAAFAAAVERLATHEPVQYVIGETDFMGLRIRCDRRALIPRPETEVLTGHAEDFLRELPSPRVVDVCTGSGCIACALAKRVPHARVWATDISAAALDLARENARALGAAVEFRQTDLLAGFADDSMDMVIANPPYVSTADCARLARTVRDFEPHLALDGGADGLRLISRLVSEAARVLTSGGKLLLEIAEDQAVVVPELLCAQTQLSLLSRKSDYAGNWRVVIAVRNPR